MNLLAPVSKFLLIHILMLSCSYAIAQEKKVAQTPQELYNEIAKMDSILFAAFNQKDIVKFQSLFSKDLEWFQDNDGLLNYEKVFSNFPRMFKEQPTLTRELVAGSFEVHPVKNYGAIETGTHRFRHIENGKEEIGTFKSLMIWQKKDGQWKLSRVVSYDH